MDQNINLKLSNIICLTIKKLNEELNEANKLGKNYRPKYKRKIVQIKLIYLLDALLLTKSKK